MPALLDTFNSWSTAVVAAGWAHFVQLTVLGGLLLMIDLTLGRRLGPAWRCALWLLFFVKLVLPPGLALPTSPVYWRHEPIVVAPAPSPLVQTGASWSDDLERVTAESDGGSIARNEKSDTRFPWAACGLLTWIGGVFALGGATWVRHRRLHRLLRRSEPATAALHTVFEQARERVGLKRPVDLRLSPVALAPLVTGLRRPVVHLPHALVARLSADQLQAVLVHELYHVKRGDLWVAAGQSLARVLCFHHPVLWWVNAHLSRLREQATDRAVLSHPEISCRAYNLALLETATLVAAGRPHSPFALGVIETKSQLHERITMNFRHSRSGRVQLGLPGLLSIILLGLLLLPMMAAQPEANRGGAPSPSFTAVEAAPLADLVDRTSQSIFDAFNRRDRAAFLAAFASEPIIAPDQSGLLTGRSGVTDMYLRAPMGMSYVGADWSERTLYELENWVIELGTLGFKFRLHPDAPVMTEPRAALSIWEKTAEGDLRVKLLTWNRLSDASGLAQKSAATAFEGRTAVGSPLTPDDVAEVLALEERFHRAFEIQDLDTAIAFYAEGAALMSPRARPLHGRDAIAEYLHGRRPGQLAQRIEREVAHVEAGGDHVLVVNLFRWTFIPPETDVPLTVVGKGTHLWERSSDGAWHILFDLPNASQPTG